MAIAAKVTMAEGRQRHVATLDCTAESRFAMGCPVEMFERAVTICIADSLFARP
jgi:hypothetical protein